MAASTEAQDVNISLSDTSAIAGETFLVPLRISPIDETDAVISGTFKFNMNEAVFEIIGFEKTGTILENTPNIFFNVGTNTLAFAGVDTLVGSGTLINLKVKAKDNAAYFAYTDVTFSEASLNEGNPTVNATGARFTIKGINIQPRSSNISILEGDSLQFTLSGNVAQPVTWSVTDTTIGTISSNGMFKAKTFGLVQVKAYDNQGLRDSTAFFRVQPAVLSELAITIPEVSVRQTKSISLPIYISDVSGLEILSADLQVNYNQNYLTLNGVTSGGTMTESWGEPTIQRETGSIKIASAGTDTLVGFGTLFYLNFTVNDIGTGSFPINFVYANLNEELSITLNNGSFTVLAKPVMELNQSDTAISIGQNIDFEVIGGNGTAPYTWEVDDTSIATIDQNSGELTGISRGDVLINAIDDEGFISELINVRVNDFDAYLDSSTVIFPDTIEVALRTGDLTTFNVLSYEAEIAYDTTKLEFLDLVTIGTQSEDASAEATVDENLKVAAAGTSFLGGSDSIIILKFAQKDNVDHLDVLKLDLKYLVFDEPGTDIPTTSPKPGIVSVIKIDPPSAPILASPVNASVDQDTSITFDWNSSLEATNYTLQVGTDDNFAGVVLDTTISETAFTLNGLNYLTFYYWRVKASNLGGDSEWSDTLSFKTVIEKPEIPSLLFPVDSLDRAETTAFLSWNAADRADSYIMQLTTAEDFSTIDYEKVVFDTVTNQAGLTYLTDYYWRVKATNTGGESDYSEERTFQTKAIPAEVPVLELPADVSIDTDTVVTLSWIASNGAISYEYQLGTDDNFNGIVQQGNIGSDTSLTVTGLDFLTSYYWRVRTIGAQDTSDYSQPFSFTTKIALPATPTLVSPTDGLTELPLSLDLVWNTAERADDYKVEISAINDFSSLVLDQTVSDTTVLATGLTNSTDYFWRVQSNNTTGGSAYSEVRTFQTKAVDASVPVLISPVSGSVDTDTTITLIWSSAVGALEYHYEVSDASDFSSITATTIGLDTSAVVDGLEYLTQYFWRARAIGAQDTSDWSGVFDFTTKIAKPDVPELVSPANASIELPINVSLSWKTAPRAVEYVLEVAGDNTFNELVIDSTLSDTTLEAIGLDYLTDYYWRVKATNTSGESDYSEERTFQTKAQDATIPQLLSPEDNAIDVDINTILVWSETVGALIYEYQLSNVSDFSTILVGSTISDTTSSITDLAMNTEYFWRVRGIGVQDTSNWSTPFSFVTRLDELTVPILKTPSMNAVGVEDSLEFVWTSVSGADSYQFVLDADTLTEEHDVSLVLNDTTVAVENLMFSTTYYWKVKAKDTLNLRESVWTPWFLFTTKNAPDVDPVVSIPLGEIILEEDFADSLIANLTEVFIDQGGDLLTYQIIQDTDLVLSNISQDMLSLTSKADTSGTAELVVQAQDPSGNIVMDTLFITVTPVNDLPYIVQIPDSIAFKQGELFEFFIDTSFADIEDEVSELTFSTSVSPTDVFAVFDPTTFKISLTSPVYIGFAELTIVVVDSDGGELTATIVLDVMPVTSNEFNEGVPIQFSLEQNYPNPFNPSSTINFGIPEASDVRIDVFNMLGQHISTLVDSKMQAGYHSVVFEASSLSSGIYIYRIVAGDFVQTKRMMLIK
jgi:hypothetical protein